ncbi:hypothetical protein K402DRAFT_345558 [Aulographum hederae CBS 113979]|uniref:Eukaryotic translation initiation factor 3 subunit A n=1 Tax=Aulographum hederae CBS 113979 TaxID=1176131 RepID=A0A6G1HG34_9PEZI|nr:hypothetical protein K402DRAFT_345558 [Aulographum hederae CBS 113979]
MPPPPHSRPENVLKRAQELLGVGQAQTALSVLHDHVVSKRSRNNAISALEPVMLLFVELCVDLRRGKLAKDGLYQYKNTAQNTNIATIELVFTKFIELAENKVTEAQEKANEDTTLAEDLEATETPESILLATVSGEQAKDRTDRAIVTPWLKFLWETYRTVLDIFKNNARLETMYQSTVHQAFQFCSKYARKTEFRRLCELLRNHLQNAAKFSQQMHAINLSDPDTLQRHLDTRFQQLNVAVELELWQEAFRSIEDIHTLLNLSKRPAKNIMMANYFEKLTRIFLVSENYLFHAAAWSRYYNLMRQSATVVAAGQGAKKDNPAVTEADMTKAASFVLLSALSIPVISTSRSRGALVDVDEARKNKNVRLTNLLGMTTAPTRAILFKDALSKGLLRRCRPEIRELYNILEVDFHPLSICQKISPILAKIGADPEMEKYILPLQQVILTRLFQQLSQVYESVNLSFVFQLAQFPDPFQVSEATIEKFIMNGCKKGDLAIRVDHASGVLTFDTDVFSSGKALHAGAGAGSAESQDSPAQQLQSTPSDIVRSQLTRLAKTLYVTCQYVDRSFNEERVRAKEAALARAAEGAEKEHRDALARREVIDQQKLAASTALAQKEKDLATEKRLRAQQQQAAEAKRLADEQRERDLRRLQAERKRIQDEEAARALEELKRGMKGIDLGDIDPANLDSGTIRAIKINALEKEKSKMSEILSATGRRIDHLERALRQEEAKHLPEDYEAQRKKDIAAYEKAKNITLTDAKLKHKEDVALKHRLSRLIPAYEDFRKTIQQQRKADFDKRRKNAEKELQQKMDQRKKEFRERKLRERREREEAEQHAREEEEKAAREAEEKAKADEERRAKMIEEKARREEERKRLDEQAAKQRQREAEAEAKLAAKKGGAAPPRTLERPSAPVERPTSTEGPSRGPPRLNLAGNKPSWRERQAQKEAEGGAAPTAAADAPPSEAPRPNRFVPPAMRDREGSGRGGDAPPRDAPLRDAPPRDAPPREAREPWRAREGSGAGAGSPAPGPGKFVPPHLRSRDRDGSSDRGGLTMERQSSGSGQAPAGGAYRPGAFKGRRE